MMKRIKNPRAAPLLINPQLGRWVIVANPKLAQLRYYTGGRELSGGTFDHTFPSCWSTNVDEALLYAMSDLAQEDAKALREGRLPEGRRGISIPVNCDSE